MTAIPRCAANCSLCKWNYYFDCVIFVSVIRSADFGFFEDSAIHAPKNFFNTIYYCTQDTRHPSCLSIALKVSHVCVHGIVRVCVCALLTCVCVCTCVWTVYAFVFVYMNNMWNHWTCTRLAMKQCPNTPKSKTRLHETKSLLFHFSPSWNEWIFSAFAHYLVHFQTVCFGRIVFPSGSIASTVNKMWRAKKKRKKLRLHVVGYLHCCSCLTYSIWTHFPRLDSGYSVSFAVSSF